MTSDVLVCYPRPDGDTAQVAMTVAEQLSRRGLRVELRRCARVSSPDGYRAVVLGGAVSRRHWDPAAVDVLTRCREGQPLWLFHTDFHTDFDTGSDADDDAAGELPVAVRAAAQERGLEQPAVLADVVPGGTRSDGGRRVAPVITFADRIASALETGPLPSEHS